MPGTLARHSCYFAVVFKNFQGMLEKLRYQEQLTPTVIIISQFAFFPH
jgi:hypothetical protein